MIIRDFDNFDAEEQAFNKLYNKRLKSYNSSAREIKKKELFSFQRTVLESLISNLNQFNYCILNLDTGLGKTFITLYLISHCYEKSTSVPILIVSPANNICDPWIKEIKEYNQVAEKKITYYEYHGSGKELLAYNNSLSVSGCDVILTSYQTLTNSNSNPYFRGTQFSLIIFDEPQKIINSQKATETLKDLSFVKGDYRIALTASPLSNSVRELYILESFIKDPELIDSTYNFVEMMNNNLEAIEKECERFIPIISESKEIEAIRKEINLPNLVEYKILAPLAKSVKDKLGALNSFPEKSKLLSCSSLFLNNQGELFFDSKIKILKLILSKIPNDDKVIIFSMYTEGLDKLLGELSEDNYVCFKTDGKMTEKARRLEITNFKRYKKKAIMLASIKANETGLNYQEANNVIFLDTWYNPQVIKQARDRCFRTGQTKNVNVFYLSTDTEFEKNIWNTEKAKLEVASKLLRWERVNAHKVFNYSDDKNYLKKISNLLDKIYI